MQGYRHFKGNKYWLHDVGRCPDENEFYAIYSRSPDAHTLMAFALHSETKELYYIHSNRTIRKATADQMSAADISQVSLWVRPLDMFYGFKEMPDGSKIRRFERQD